MTAAKIVNGAVVEEIPICGCTGEQLERMAAECFGGKPHLVPDAFKCPCGHRHLVGPGLEKAGHRIG